MIIVLYYVKCYDFMSDCSMSCGCDQNSLSASAHSPGTSKCREWMGLQHFHPLSSCNLTHNWT